MTSMRPAADDPSNDDQRPTPQLSPAGTESSRRAFLTVVTRTQGIRPQLLGQALDSVAEQTDRDVEVIVVCHRADEAGRARVEQVVAGLPPWLRDRTRVLDRADGARGAPLNTGFEQSTGHYVSVLDDDDLVLPEWVATFRDLAGSHPGRVLRTRAWRQEVELVDRHGEPQARPTGERIDQWPARFHLLDHLLVNSSPFMTLAFPRTAVIEAGLRFDESLQTVEDSDFLMRAVNQLGIACADAHTAVYRWWSQDEGSRAAHDSAQWRADEDRVRDRLDALSWTLPPGSVGKLRVQVEDLRAERDREAANARQLLGEAEQYLSRLQDALRRLGEAEEKIGRLRGKVARLRGRADP